MSSVFASFEDYKHIFKKFNISVIENRYQRLVNQYKSFISDNDWQEKVFLNELVLQYAVLDYFSDIGRLKDFHKIHLINNVKVISYESYWLWRRKPLQLYDYQEESSDSEFCFANELFVYNNMLSFLTDNIPDNHYFDLKEKHKTSDIDSFMQTFYYFLKFRQCNPQFFELVLLSFLAGKQFFQD